VAHFLIRDHVLSDGPDYNSYANAELIEAYESIDRDSYSERFQRLCEIMKGKGLLIKTDAGYQFTEKANESIWGTESEEATEPTYTCLPPEPKYDDDGNYIPNEIALKNRLTNSLFSLGIILYGSYGLYVNELWVPLAKRISIVLSGISAILMFLAILCASVMMIAEVVDHYDTRDNEHTYYKVALYFKYAAYAGFGIAVLVGLITGARIE